uniref:NADH dehydrogenase subunit 4L n=1 Tax=Colpocephalum eucarenum TaxID=2965266 RepID=UPI0026E3FE60|nr:NADH dehydrogenase subunit 4L [Colpocephalum eucarenum]WIM51517.1 NADH dehydrogenase subunit 4L [Colpocephalum eucarenum]
MFNIVEIFFIFFFFMGLMKILMSEKIISILMSIEVVMLSLFFLLYMLHKFWFPGSVMCVVYLTFMVCESVLGLGAYISISRMSGKDQFKTMNLIK